MLKRSALAAAATLALGMSVVGNAHADAWANAWLEVSNFAITNAGTALDHSDFSSLSYSDSYSLSATAGGVTNAAGGNNSVLGAPLVSPIVCALSCKDPYAPGGPPPVAYGTSVHAGLVGIPISIAASGISAGANASTAAFGEVIGGGSGTGTSKLQLNSTITFGLNNSAASAGLSFNVEQVLKAFTAGNLLATASAGNGLTFSLADTTGGGNTNLFRWAPDGGTGGVSGGSKLTVTSSGNCNVNGSVYASVPPAGGYTDDASCNGSYSGLLTTALLAGHTYTFGITHTSSIDYTEAVPEPSSLMLIGLALVGLGATSLRRKRQA